MKNKKTARFNDQLFLNNIKKSKINQSGNETDKTI